jgi:hypothetical protein
MNMVYLAIWMSVVASGLLAYFARRQARLNTELERKLSEQEARADKLAGYVQRALEDTYVLSTVMAERGHIDHDAMEQGRERLIKRIQKNEPKAEAPAETQPHRILH